MAADFTPLAQVLKAKANAGGGRPASPGHDTALFTSLSAAAAGAATSNGETAFSGSRTPSASPEQHRAVNIEVKRDGERISQIRVQCRCGELIEIDCEY